MEAFLLDNVFWLMLAAASASGLIWTFARAEQWSLSPQAASLLANREGGLFVDVRPPAEFAAGHIAKARNIPASELESKLDTLNKYREKPVIVVCQNGMRGRTAAAQLRKANFTQVRVLAGGVGGWLDAQLPLSKKKEKS